jgi:hypothetical protein
MSVRSPNKPLLRNSCSSLLLLLTFLLTHTLLVLPFQLIKVKVNRPEANRELPVFQLDNIPGVIKAEERYHGYSIQMMVNIQWTLDNDTIDHYTSHVWKEDALLFHFPAFPYTILHNCEEMNINGTIPRNIIDSMDNACRSFHQAMSCRQRQSLMMLETMKSLTMTLWM